MELVARIDDVLFMMLRRSVEQGTDRVLRRTPQHYLATPGPFVEVHPILIVDANHPRLANSQEFLKSVWQLA